MKFKILIMSLFSLFSFKVFAALPFEHLAGKYKIKECAETQIDKTPYGSCSRGSKNFFIAVEPSPKGGGLIHLVATADEVLPRLYDDENPQQIIGTLGALKGDSKIPYTEVEDYEVGKQTYTVVGNGSTTIQWDYSVANALGVTRQLINMTKLADGAYQLTQERYQEDKVVYSFKLQLEAIK